MPIAKAGEISLEYYTEGSGPPLLLIMGFAGSAHSWGAPFVEQLTRNFTVTRFSNRGTGDSDKPSEQPTIRMMADDTVALLDALGIGRSARLRHLDGRDDRAGDRDQLPEPRERPGAGLHRPWGGRRW